MSSADNQLQLEDIQAHVIRTAGPAAARYYFLSITQPEKFADFIKSDAVQNLLISDQSYHQRGPDLLQHGCFANLAFTFNGLRFMGVDAKTLDLFPPAFSEGMANRAAFIGDHSGDEPATWEGYFGSPQLHALLVIQFSPRLDKGWKGAPDHWSKRQRKQHFAAIDDCVAQLCIGDGSFPGTRCLMQEKSHAVRHEGKLREHFGFVDGISQPWVDVGPCSQNRKGGGKLSSTEGSGEWEALAAGEFILGYYDELGLKNKPQDSSVVNPLLPVPSDPERARYHGLTQNGSFLVYRKLEQDVAAFRELCKHDSKLAEQLVGRSYDGKPLISSKSTAGDNDFDFADDPEGRVCPFSSHIRRSNPRVTLSAGANKTTERADQHRIIRRGMPYGQFVEPNKKVPKNRNKRRGLQFVCYNARIDSQFEFIQHNWINNSDFISMPSPVLDPLVGSRTPKDAGQFCFGSEQLPLFGIQQYIHVKGGDYFFAPGLKGLLLIAGGARPLNPFAVPPKTVQPWDPESSDPIKVTPYLEPSDLLEGQRYKRFTVASPQGSKDYYYFGHPEDVIKIMSDPDQFTNIHYSAKIKKLTGADMLLSAPDTEQRRELKINIAAHLDHQQLMQNIESVVTAKLKTIGRKFARCGKMDLVDELARCLPLVIIKQVFGIRAPKANGDGIYSKAQIAHYFNRKDFDSLPADWKQNYATKYGFKTNGDDTLLFWVRMLFLEVFLNQYNAQYISDQAENVVSELLPHLDSVITRQMKRSPCDATLLQQLISMFRQQTAMSDEDLLPHVRQILLELMVGGTDTTSKGIVLVVNRLLQFGPDLHTGFAVLTKTNPQAMELLHQWLNAKEVHSEPQAEAMEPALNAMLDTVITNCLRMDPVAPLIPRVCPTEVQYQSSTGEVLNIAAGSVVCVVPKITLAGNLMGRVPADQERFVFMDGLPHACLGHQIAMLEMRETLKLLLQLPAVRAAAGKTGTLELKYDLPRKMELRCGS